MSRKNFMAKRGKSPVLLASNPVYKAFAKNPMAINTQNDVYLPAQAAFASVQAGTANTADRESLAMLANIIMILAEKHCSAEDLASAKEAQYAISRADRRVLEGKHWNLDGPGRLAIMQALSTHEQQISQLNQVDVTNAALEMMSRNKNHKAFKLGAMA